MHIHTQFAQRGCKASVRFARLGYVANISSWSGLYGQRIKHCWSKKTAYQKGFPGHISNVHVDKRPSKAGQTKPLTVT